MQSQVITSVDITAKWELATRISGHAKAPSQALRSIFDGIMNGLEKRVPAPFASEMKERIWSKVSKERLTQIQDAFILEFCNQILGGFKGDEAEEMLEEHKRTGFVKEPIKSGHIQTAYHFHRDDIITAICKKAEGMATDWIPEIIKAVNEEGIELLDPHQQKTP